MEGGEYRNKRFSRYFENYIAVNSVAPPHGIRECAGVLCAGIEKRSLRAFHAVLSSLCHLIISMAAISPTILGTAERAEVG